MAFPAAAGLFLYKFQAIVVASFLLASSSTISARMLEFDSIDLMSRLKVDQPRLLTSCWDALFQLQSCNGEVVVFFMNGETSLGAGCCNAIRTIEHNCWPSILGTLGITPEESGILQGYCDATTDQASPPPASSCNALPRFH